MDENSKPLAADEIIELFKGGELTAYIFSYENFDDQESTFTLYSELHNAGKIDLLSLTQGPQFDAINQDSFFAGQHFFCEVIPKLQASTSEMMLCVSRLIKKGGQDLAANQPNAAFREWCSADLARSQEVIKLARVGDALAPEFLTFALEAGQSFEEALDILNSYSNGRRLSAITAISRMKLRKDQVEEALAVLLTTVSSDVDDVLFANVLRSSFEIAAKSDATKFPNFQAIVARICDSAGPQVHYSSAQILWTHTKLLSADLFSFFARALGSLDPAHKATVHQLDSGLRHLLSTQLALDGIHLLQNLLMQHPQNLKLSEFSSFGHKLLENPESILQKVVVEWLLSGERALCDGLSHLLSGSDKGDKPIRLSAEYLDLPAHKQIFICRKAIGYFFVQPVFAASIVVSVLRVCSEEASAHIKQLLIDPLLRNYGGKLREFLSAIGESDPAFSGVKFALDGNDRYLAEIKTVGEIKELSPSELQRQAVHRSDSDEVRKSHKEAMKKSVFMSLVHRSVILYGKRTLTVVQGPGSERRLMEMDLKSHSFGWELPRSTIIDPVGLDFMLRVFRNERFRDETHSA